MLAASCLADLLGPLIGLDHEAFGVDLDVGACDGCSVAIVASPLIVW